LYVQHGYVGPSAKRLSAYIDQLDMCPVQKNIGRKAGEDHPSYLAAIHAHNTRLKLSAYT